MTVPTGGRTRSTRIRPLCRNKFDGLDRWDLTLTARPLLFSSRRYSVKCSISVTVEVMSLISLESEPTWSFVNSTVFRREDFSK